ncbi:hypothetical protein AB0M28_00085 [Streptomyces sp. NPDC051940]|uniref:hypothetical protein n=1 Tax=Streptomyces sp. NPDC051940 TaxID=3155675 RepID=UPI0034174420
MKATFEDRLLGELKREIELREPAPAPARRRIVTVPRLALAAGMATAAAVAAVMVPGAPGTSQAFAVEKNPDGSVTVTVDDLTLSASRQKELAERLRAEGVRVSIDSLALDEACERPRGEQIQPERMEGPDWRITLDRGDTLAIENNVRADGAYQASTLYGIEGKAEACNPVAGLSTLPGPVDKDAKPIG